MEVEKIVKKLRAAVDLMIGHAMVGPGGSSGQVACAEIILALADDQKCDFSVLEKLHGETAEAAGTVINGCLVYGKSAVFGPRQQQIDEFKSYFS